MSVGKQRRVLDSALEHTSIYKVRRRENAFKRLRNSNQQGKKKTKSVVSLKTFENRFQEEHNQLCGMLLRI